MFHSILPKSIAYLPREEAKAYDWMVRFAKALSKNPQKYGLAPGDAAKVQQRVDQYAEAYRLGNRGRRGRRSLTDVSRKDQKRAAAERICRQYYSRIKFNDDISDTVKIGIGVRPVNRRRRKVKGPKWPPTISVVACTRGLQTLIYQPFNSARRAKPRGAIQLQLYRTIADAPARDPEAAHLCGVFTRTPFNVPVNSSDAGRTVTYFARWVSQRGQFSAYSLPVSVKVWG